MGQGNSNMDFSAYPFQLSEEEWKNLSNEDLRRGYEQAQMQKIQETILLQRRLLVQEARQGDRPIRD